MPRLIRFSGMAKDANDKPLSNVVGVTFSLYKDEQGGSPLWLETQNVQPDASGRYTVQLGATKPDGLPTDLFTFSEARWVGVQLSGQDEKPRVLLLPVPYALKAVDAETIGGLPPSAFMKASAAQEGSQSEARGPGITAGSISNKLGDNPQLFGVTTAGGKVGQLPIWNTTHDIESSVITQVGSGATAKTGVGTANPASTLDVNGTINTESSINVDATNTNKGALSPGLLLGLQTGEGISSARTAGSTNEDGLDFWTSFTRRVSITNGGNVGIGTTTPGARLDVLGSDSSPQAAGMQVSTPTFPQYLFNAKNGASNAKIWRMIGRGTNDFEIQTLSDLYNGEVTAMQINRNGTSISNVDFPNGNVGIGTTKPGAALDVNAQNQLGVFVEGPVTGIGSGIQLQTTGTNGIGWEMLNTGVTSSQGYGKLNFRFFQPHFFSDLMTLDTGLQFGPTCKTGVGCVGIGTTHPQHLLHMGDGAYEDGGTWTNASDRNLKENFAAVDATQLLAKIDAMPIQTWNYKSEGKSVRHLGPVAQDFHTAFGVGQDDKHISTVDEGGVALAAIQELHQLILKKNNEVSALNQQIVALNQANLDKDARIQQLSAQVDQLQQLQQTVQILSTRLSKIENAASPAVLTASR